MTTTPDGPTSSEHPARPGRLPAARRLRRGPEHHPRRHRPHRSRAPRADSHPAAPARRRPGAARGLPRARGAVVAVVTLAVAVAVVLAVVVTGLSNRTGGDASAATTNTVEQAATTGTQAALSYDYRHLGSDFAAAEKLMTPGFAANYKKHDGDLGPDARHEVPRDEHRHGGGGGHRIDVRLAGDGAGLRRPDGDGTPSSAPRGWTVRGSRCHWCTAAATGWSPTSRRSDRRVGPAWPLDVAALSRHASRPTVTRAEGRARAADVDSSAF